MIILMVEDDIPLRFVLREYLREEGWIVFEAGNGVEGLKTLEDNKIDVILSDVYMPVMDGLKFFNTIKADPELNKVPFLFMSAHDDELTRMAIQSSANVGFWKKGKQTDELKAWLQFLTTPVEKRKGSTPFNRSLYP